MDSRIRDILNQITGLEDKLKAALDEREHQVYFTYKGKRVQFERSGTQAHRKLKKNLGRWLLHSNASSVLSAPFIYGMIIPLLFLDLSFTVYQAICFRLYRIAPVKRSHYIAIDRHRLAYLNTIEKLNCVYCGYGNGLIAYISEIAARTEQYWCPIKHARQVLGSHARYARFLEYGDAADYHERLNQFREALASDASPSQENVGNF